MKKGLGLFDRKSKPLVVQVDANKLLNAVPENWAAQYPPHRYGPETSQGKTREKLLALDIWGRSRERMNEIIGNPGWTMQHCDRCNADSDLIIQIGDEPDYEARYVDLCPDCVREIAELAKE